MKDFSAVTHPIDWSEPNGAANKTAGRELQI